MAFQISPFGNDQFFTSNGVLAVGAKLFTYLAGTTTKTPVYTDVGGLTPHTNPIILNSIGMPPSPIFLSKGATYKFVYAPSTDTDPPSAPIYPADNVSVGTVITEGGNLTGGINAARTTVASAAVPDIFAVTVGNTVDYTGTTICTGFVAAPQAGPQRILVCAGAAVFTAGANMLIDGVASGINFTAAAGDKVFVIAVTTTQFRMTPMLATGMPLISRQIGNPIINGNMEIWQRGTAFAAAANGTYAADRWCWGQSGAGVVTLNRSTTVPSVADAGVLFNYSLEVDVTTADASIAAGDLYVVSQRIEGYNWRHFAQRQFTVSFWVSSTKTGIHCLALRNNSAGTPDRCYVAEFTVNATDTPEYKIVTVLASPSAGTWDYLNGAGLELAFVLAAGSTFQTTANAWQTGNFYATANQVDAVDNAANFFRITGIKLELGSVATPIQFRSFQDELTLCIRYFQKSFPYATAPSQNMGIPAHQFPAPVGASTLFTSVFIPFIMRMRAIPSGLTLYNPSVANAQIRNVTLSSDCTGSGVVTITETGFGVSATTPASTTIGANSMQVHWTADAEL